MLHKCRRFRPLPGVEAVEVVERRATSRVVAARASSVGVEVPLQSHGAHGETGGGQSPRWAVWQAPQAQPCPQCGGLLVPDKGNTTATCQSCETQIDVAAAAEQATA
jgi:hypothetical protein